MHRGYISGNEQSRKNGINYVIKKEQINITTSVSAAVVIAVAAVIYLVKFVIIPETNYNNAVALLEQGKNREAAATFASLGEYKDSAEQNKKILKDVISYYSEKSKLISAGGYHTVGLKADGTVVVVGSKDYGKCNVSEWKDIVAVSAGEYHTVGLKSDGTVVAVGYNCSGQCYVSDWKDIVAISAGGYHTVGLKANGTVMAVGDIDIVRYNVSNWKNIVAVSAGEDYTVGLKIDGTVVATGNNVGQCDVSGWKDIVAISAGEGHTVGLKADGTVVATGNNNVGQCDVSDWKLKTE